MATHSFITVCQNKHAKEDKMSCRHTISRVNQYYKDSGSILPVVPKMKTLWNLADL